MVGEARTFAYRPQGVKLGSEARASDDVKRNALPFQRDGQGLLRFLARANDHVVGLNQLFMVTDRDVQPGIVDLGVTATCESLDTAALQPRP